MAPKGFVACKVCGRIFGEWSIGFHEPKCLQKSTNEHNKLNPRQRQKREVIAKRAQEEIRPTTAVLEHPRILDESKMVDMTCYRVARQSTVTLPKASGRIPQLVAKKYGDKTRKRVKKGREVHVVQSTPTACTSCGRNSLPERFHSHLSNQQRVKSKSAENLSQGKQQRSVVDKNNNRLYMPPIKSKEERKETTQPQGRIDVNGYHAREPLQLTPCPNCGRTFFPDRLDVHVRSCMKTLPVPIANRSAPASYNVQSPPQRKFIICYICGREFGSLSISIHEPQCMKKWEIENRKLPKHLQRARPKRPDTIMSERGTLDIDAMAEAAWKVHLDQLIPCDKCGRKFFPDRLEVHSRSCKDVKQRPR